MAKPAPFSSPRWKPGMALPGPPRLPVCDQHPRQRPKSAPLPPTLRLYRAVSLGGTLPLASRTPFLRGNQEFIPDFLCWSTSVWQEALLIPSSSILLFEDKRTLSFPSNTFSLSGWKNQRVIHERSSRDRVVVARGVSIGKNGITSSKLNVLQRCF